MTINVEFNSTPIFPGLHFDTFTKTFYYFPLHNYRSCLNPSALKKVNIFVLGCVKTVFAHSH